MSYIAVIRRNADGETRACPQPFEYYKGDHDDWFWWADGNYSCDCNRELEWLRADGQEPDLDAAACSEGRFSVVRFELPDGRVIPGPDAGETP